jgi:hypothetical protein
MLNIDIPKKGDVAEYTPKHDIQPKPSSPVRLVMPDDRKITKFDSSLDKNEIFTKTLQAISDYSFPGIGIDRNSYLPIDHVRIDPASGLTFGRGMYSAAAKVAAYTVFLLKIYEGEGSYSKVSLKASDEEIAFITKNIKLDVNNKNIALLRLHRMFDTIMKCLTNEEEKKTAPYLGGMLAWLSINRDGNISRDKDLVPLLDNGLLSWSYAALIGKLEEDEAPFARQVCSKAADLLKMQNYSLFIDRVNSKFFGEIDVTTGAGNPKYMLERVWTEDVLSILWGLFTAELTEDDRLKIWNNTTSPLIEWMTGDGEKIHAPRGYVSSNHELIWTLMYAPLSESRIKDLFFNSQYLQADFASRTGSPGFQAVAYNPVGAYMKMGIPQSSEFPEYVQKSDNAVAFATAAGMLADNNVGGDWLASLIENCHMLTPYGPLESIGIEGRADILSADSQYLIASAIGGGVREEVKKFLIKRKVTGSEETYYDFMKRYLDIKYETILKRESISSILSPSKPFPSPSKVEFDFSRFKFPAQKAEFEILDHLSESSDDRHGANAHSPKEKNLRWEIDKDGLLVRYTIPEDANRYYRFAWWGTYMGKNRPYPAAYTDLAITVPYDCPEQKFFIYLKREDCTLVKPIPVNTRRRGVVSEDGRWKTYTFPLKHYKRFIRCPLTYISFAVSDPRKNPAHMFGETVRIKSVRLFNRYTGGADVDVGKIIMEAEKRNIFVSPPARPDMPYGQAPLFIDSGAIGDATEDVTKEEKGLIYMEFENVNIDYGFAGIWTLFNDVNISSFDYLVFDVRTGEVDPPPSHLLVEFKNQLGGGETERLICAFDIDMTKCDISADNWHRVFIRVPTGMRKKKVNMLNFVCRNRIDKLSNGSLIISSPAFLKDEPYDKGSRLAVRTRDYMIYKL